MKKYLLFFFSIFLLGLCSVHDALNAEEIITWGECVKLAAQNHPDLQSAAAKTAQAKANVGITRGDLLPTIDATAAASKTKAETGGNSTTSDSYSYGVTGKQLLFDSGKIYYDTKNKEKTAESVEYNYQVVSATIRQNLRYAFIKLLSAQEMLKTDKEIAKIRKDNYELVNMRYKSGLEHKGSVLTAEANLAQAEVALSQDERNIAFSQANLIKCMGIEQFKPYTAQGDLIIVASYDQKPDMELLANSNPQLKVIVQQRIGAEYNLLSSKLDYSPKVYGTVSVDRSGTQWPPSNTEYSAGVQMSLNLFQGGKSLDQTSLAEATYKQLFADEKSTHNTLIFYLEQAWANLKNYIDTTNVQKKFLTAAEERAKIADSQYSIGSVVFDNWIVIQNNLVSAKQNYLTAISNALLYEADWIQAKGGTLTYGE